ncbi:MAG: pyridoxamine 5'-phosphate oxidase family protein [Candidatus Bathyarchaeota archaeon]|nr:MAG: pyridoxamine 5'-phosphate oxidase family protein [Candidatus Bathyarchaeota archaeon]
MSKMDDEVLKEIESYYNKENLIALATADGDQPCVRVVTLISLDDGLFVITGARGGANTAKVRQIKENPNVAFVLQIQKEGKIGNIRGEGTASIIDDPELKTQIFKEIKWTESYFKSPEDPSYVLLGINVRSYQYSIPGTGRRVMVSVS